MCDNAIQNDSVIGLDSEFDQSLFHDVIVIIQISCHFDFFGSFSVVSIPKS
jgi:hypothetical protein